MPVMKAWWAPAIEVAGVVILVGCSLAPPPTSSMTGIEAPGSGWAIEYVGYNINIDDTSFGFSEAPVPAGPGPEVGQRVRVDYLDVTLRNLVIDVVVDPGQPDSMTYVTTTGLRYDQHLGWWAAARAGLVAGFALMIAGAVLVFWRVRRAGAAAVAVATAGAPLSLLGAMPLIAAVGGVPVIGLFRSLEATAWAGSAVVVLVGAAAGWREPPPKYARRALLMVLAIGEVLILGWVGWFLSLPRLPGY